MGERSRERERERRGSEREIYIWGSECARERGRLLKREREREYENREGKENSLKNRCAKIVCLQ